MNSRQIAVAVAWKMWGLPYKWGGDDPMASFDCSGMIVEILKSVGILPRSGDWTAQGLWNLFKSHQVDPPYEGCLVFWKDDHDKVIHVELCLDDKLSIGASGGGINTVTKQDAIDQNAYIKIRPFRSRSFLKGFLDPF
jgi:cell wall-associated NlpC family hydrolase